MNSKKVKRPVKIYKNGAAGECMPSALEGWLARGWTTDEVVRLDADETLDGTGAGGEDAAALGEGQQAGPTPALVDPLNLSDAGAPAEVGEGDVTASSELG